MRNSTKPRAAAEIRSGCSRLAARRDFRASAAASPSAVSAMSPIPVPLDEVACPRAGPSAYRRAPPAADKRAATRADEAADDCAAPLAVVVAMSPARLRRP